MNVFAMLIETIYRVATSDSVRADVAKLVADLQALFQTASAAPTATATATLPEARLAPAETNPGSDLPTGTGPPK